MENGHHKPDRSHRGRSQRRNAREMPATFENYEDPGGVSGTSHAVTQADRVVLIDPRPGGETVEYGAEESESRRTVYVYMHRRPTEADLMRYLHPDG